MTTAENILLNIFLPIAMAAYMFAGVFAIKYTLSPTHNTFYHNLNNRVKTLCVLGIFATAILIYMLVAAFGAGYYSDIDWYKSWGDYMLEHGIYNFYRDCDADYPPLFLYINTALTWFAGNTGISARFTYKAFFGLVTVASAAPLYFIIKRRTSQLTATVFAALYLLAPVNITDSAAWGQSDTIIGCAAIILYDFISREKWLAFFAAALIAMLLKTQIILLLPAVGMYIIYLMIKRRLYLKFIVYAVCIIAIYVLMYLPFGLTYINEGNWLFLIDIFIRQTGHYPYLSANANNLWMAIGLNFFSSQAGIGAVLKYAAYAMTIAASVLIFIATIKSKAENNVKLALMFTLQGTACYMFLPAMHERYWVPVAGVMIISMALCGRKKLSLCGLGLICGQALNIIAVLLKTHGMFNVVMQVLSVIVTIISAVFFCITAYKVLFPEKKIFKWLDERGIEDGKSFSAER